MTGFTMIPMLKSVILDAQEATPDTGVPRRLRIELLPGNVAVCIGVRRCGKSTYLFQQIKRLRDTGVPRENILYLNLFDDRLYPLQQLGPGLIIDAYFSLYPEKKNTETVYCFFDEIQILPRWEAFISRLMNTEQCQIYLTGSSAHMLSREIATQLRGRALAWEMFPFSFREFLDWKGIDSAAPFSTRRQLLIRHAFEQYRACGGFPEVLGVSPSLRTRIHQEYFHTILFRDLVDRHDISHPRAVADLARKLMDNIASMYSVNRLTEYLKTLGHKAPKTAVSNYMTWFEDAYFLFSVSIFDPSIVRRNVNAKKIYCVDHALAASVASGMCLNSGHLLENLVFTALRRVYPELYYYRTRSGKEVDFVVPERGHIRALVQVCESMADTRTRARETGALQEAMGELDIHDSVIVTLEDEDELNTESGTVRIIPAWRFLLELPDAAEVR